MALQYWAFTFNAETDDEARWAVKRGSFIAFLDERGWRYVFQHERVSRDHWQGRIDLVDKDSRKTKHGLLDVFKAGGIDTPMLHLAPETNNGIKQQAVDFYVTKTESRVDGPWFDGSYTPPRKKPKYNGADLTCMESPMAWQQSCLDALTQKADDRTIVWVYNKDGCAGKSKLMKYLGWKGLAKRVCLGTATQIKTAITQAGAYAAYVVDLPRISGNQESQRDLFSALEDIKNGWVESNMYGKDSSLMMEPPHLWVLSNEVPDVRFASMDRWKILKLKDKDSSLEPMTFLDVQSVFKSQH